jgi:hypothetical protein
VSAGLATVVPKCLPGVHDCSHFFHTDVNAVIYDEGVQLYGGQGFEREPPRGIGGEEPPDNREEPSGEGPMESREPEWAIVSDDWLDKKRSDDPEIAKIQEFLDKNINAEVIRSHLLAEGIGNPGELEITKITVRNYEEKCIIESWLNVTGQAWKVKDETTGLFIENKDASKIKTDIIKMIRSLGKDSSGNIHSANFGKIGVGNSRLPFNFGDEYYLRVIPFLHIMGVKSVTITAITEANDPAKEEGRLLGAYVWPKYGYTNIAMESSIKDFLGYLQDRKVRLSNEEVDDIKSITRMREIAEHVIERDGHKLRVGRDFLLGDDGTGKYTRDVMWQGIIPDINKNESYEMKELRAKLVKSEQG